MRGRKCWQASEWCEVWRVGTVLRSVFHRMASMLPVESLVRAQWANNFLSESEMGHCSRAMIRMRQCSCAESESDLISCRLQATDYCVSIPCSQSFFEHHYAAAKKRRETSLGPHLCDMHWEICNPRTCRGSTHVLPGLHPGMVQDLSLARSGPLIALDSS